MNMAFLASLMVNAHPFPKAFLLIMETSHLWEALGSKSSGSVLSHLFFVAAWHSLQDLSSLSLDRTLGPGSDSTEP